MKKEEFEKRLVEIWVQTGIPLTEANLQYASGEPRRKVRKWLERLTAEGVVEMSSDDAGEALWTVPGSRRPHDGPRTFSEWERLQALRADVAAESRRRQQEKERLLAEAKQRQRDELALARRDERVARRSPLEDLQGEVGRQGAAELAQRARSELTRKPGEGEKSLLLSGGLSMVFGPLGWLYAGSFREAIPAAFVYLIAAAILTKLPLFLLMPVMLVALPISGIAGFVYAWQYNRSGERQRLWGNKEGEDE